MSDANTENLDVTEAKQSAESLANEAAPVVKRHARRGNLAAATGIISLIRAGRAFLNGQRKRGVLRALAGLLLAGVALAQRRTGGGRSTDVSDVVDTGPDIEEAADPGERDTDHATGEEVVDTTDVDIDETDTAPEVSTDDGLSEGDVDQSDVVETDQVEDVAGSPEGSEAATETDTEEGTQPSETTETDEDDETQSTSAE